MTTQRTVLVIASSAEDDMTYQQHLHQDRSMSYTILSERSGFPLPVLSQPSQRLDGILLELEPPHNRSLQFLRQLQEHTSAPVIVIDGGDTEVAVQALKHGAVDYLVKDRTTPDDLRLAMRTAIENAELKRELQRSQETFQTSVENMLDCFGIFSAMRDDSGQITDFRIDYLNAAACENNQMSKAMQIGRGLCEILPAHRDSGLFDEYCQVVETGEPLIKESLVYDDTYGNRRLVRAFDIRASKLNDGFVASWRDVTEQKQIALALQQNQERLELAMKAANMGSWDWNIPTGEVYWSTNLEHLFGMAPGSFDGRYETVRAMIHPDDLPRVEQALQGALYHGEEYHIEFRFIQPDGSVRWALGMGRVFYNEDGTPQMMAGVDMDISHRKQVEAALQASEAKLQDMVDSVPAMIWNTDPTGYCTYLNQSWYAFTGQTEATGLGFGWLDAVHPDDRATARAIFLKANEQHEAFRLEYRLRHHSGHYHWAIDAAHPWFGGDGEFKGYLGAVIDISERKQAEEALRRSEQALQENASRFRTLADNISQLAWMANEIGWIFWYNQRWFDYTGTTLEEMQGWGWQTVHHPDHLERVVAKISRCFATGEIWEDTFPLRGKDGEYRWFLSRAIPIRDEQGQVLRWFGTNTDITELRAAERALRQSEERYRCLAESIPQLVWTADGEGSLLDVNQRWTTFTGLSLDQAKTEGWEAVVHPEDVSTLTRHWAEAAQQGTPYQAEGRMRQADGTYRWFLHQAIPQRNEQGQISKWFGTATDIDMQKQLELERDRLLAQEQTAREAAERANRIKDEFLAVLSHELRSPLNPILGWARLLQTREFDTARTAAALATIERNAKLQTQLIDDLLDVAKILRGKLVMEKTTTDLTFVIESAIDTIRDAAAAKAIQLQAVIPPIGLISGDAVRLQQVIWNLLSNAIKFTPKGGRVEVKLEKVALEGDCAGALEGEDAENTPPTHPRTHAPTHPRTHAPTHPRTHAQISVSDTGKGINPNFLPHLFESFRQEDASTTRKFGGLGLGLAIVRTLVEAHGGTITADSPGAGQGATFTVQLPLIESEPQGQPPEPAPVQDLNLTGIRVLTVDDEADARELVAAVLELYGAEVLTTASAAEALSALQSFQPDVLVSDIGMPNVDGHRLIQQIRALPPEQGGQIPAIALTAYAREEDHQRVIASGFQQQVTKPLEPEQLVQGVAILVRAKAQN
jgi:PAS domain S-box-containing protein